MTQSVNNLYYKVNYNKKEYHLQQRSVYSLIFIKKFCLSLPFCKRIELFPITFANSPVFITQ